MSKEALQALFGEVSSRGQKGELNGVEIANKAVELCGKDSSIIFLKQSEYQDLIYRANLPELKSYKGKTIFIISDEIED